MEADNHLILHESSAMIAINVQAGGSRLILVIMLQEKKVIAMATVMDIADLFKIEIKNVKNIPYLQVCIFSSPIIE
jgi:hypothetical protein